MKLTTLQLKTLKLFRDLSPASGWTEEPWYVTKKEWLKRHKADPRSVWSLVRKGLLETNESVGVRITDAGMKHFNEPQVVWTDPTPIAPHPTTTGIVTGNLLSYILEFSRDLCIELISSERDEDMMAQKVFALTNLIKDLGHDDQHVSSLKLRINDDTDLKIEVVLSLGKVA